MQRIAALFFLLVLNSQAFSQNIQFNRYHSYAEINQYLIDVHNMNPETTKLQLLGKSTKGRDIYVLIIGKAPNADLPAIYFNGTHHGNEKSSTESILAMVDYLLKNQSKGSVERILSNYLVYLQPLVNPDGHVSNTRADSTGHDPNRDYSFPGVADEEAFTLPEIQIVKNLLDSVKFKAAAALHSGMEGVLYPWCYAPELVTDSTAFKYVAKKTADAMQMDLFSQSYFDYPTKGEFIDYAYWQHQTLAVTIEVSSAGNPDPMYLTNTVLRSVKGLVEFMLSVDAVQNSPAT